MTLYNMIVRMYVYVCKLHLAIPVQLETNYSDSNSSSGGELQPCLVSACIYPPGP